MRRRRAKPRSLLPSPRGRVGDGGSAVRGQGVISGVAPPSPSPFPQGKGGASALISCDGDFLGYHCQHPIDIPRHLVVPETDHAVAVGFDDAGSVRVGGAVGVLPAVEFDGETQGAAGEVGDEVADGVLAGEFDAFELAGAQVLPDAVFGVRGLVAKLAREAGQALFHYCLTPIPYPFPMGKGSTAFVAALATISTASLAQNPAPVADWPGAEIAEGVAFQGDGSVTLDASPDTGLPVITFWRPVLHDEGTRYPVAGRMDCRIAASQGPFSEEDFDPARRHKAVAAARREQGFIDGERLVSGTETVKKLDVIGRRNAPRSWYVLSYIMARDGDRLIDIRRNCTFVFGSAASKPDVLPYVNRYTKLTFAFSEQES